MNLNSLRYIVFLLVVVAVHFALRPKLRSGFLLLVSYGFYMLWQPKFALLLLATTLLSFFAAKAMQSRPTRKKAILAGALVLHFGALVFFKYLDFFAALVSRALTAAGMQALTLPDILLPVGISFYTFAVCGYLIDVYRGKQAAERNILDYALFASFFPVVLSGPIERAGHLLPQIKAARRWDAANARDGVMRFLLGLFKKMVIADQLAILVNTVFGAPETFTGVQLLAAALCYSVQIYCDFSAYSDMAIGSAKLLGFHLLENFDAPYFSTSIKEFWRRWHMSLSLWFRDYLYFPLGGSRKGKVRTYLNILIVFAVSGLWHGAATTFVIWGLLNGGYQVVGALADPARQKFWGALRLDNSSRIRRVWQTLITFGLLTVTWIFFRAGSLSQALLILKRIFTLAGDIFPLGFGAMGLGRKNLLAVGLAILALALFEGFGKKLRLYERLNETIFLRYALYTVLILVILIFGAYGSGFNAQDFVYFKF